MPFSMLPYLTDACTQVLPKSLHLWQDHAGCRLQVAVFLHAHLMCMRLQADVVLEEPGDSRSLHAGCSDNMFIRQMQGIGRLHHQHRRQVILWRTDGYSKCLCQRWSSQKRQCRAHAMKYPIYKVAVFATVNRNLTATRHMQYMHTLTAMAVFCSPVM